MPDSTSHSSRRSFLTNVAGGAAALAATGFGANELLGQGVSVYPPPQGGWDLKWVDRVEKSRYRAVFDCAGFADGVALTNAAVYYAGYKDVYNAVDADLATVVVIRHEAITMAVNDSIWERGKLGESLNVKDGDAPAVRNIWLGRKDASGVARTGPLDGLVARGAIVLCCNLALMRAAGQFARAQGMPLDEARKLYIDNLVPGIIRQTSGIFAITRAQMAGAPMVKSA